MKEKITRTVNGENYTIGYSSMMSPTHIRESGKVFKMLRLHSSDPMEEGDIHFFECVNDRWILIPDYSFINLDGNERLLDTYMNLPRNENIDFETFERLMFYCLYG